MSSSHQSTTMSLERGPENYRELGTTFLMYSALSSFVSGKGSMFYFMNWLQQAAEYGGGNHLTLTSPVIFV